MHSPILKLRCATHGSPNNQQSRLLQQANHLHMCFVFPYTLLVSVASGTCPFRRVLKGQVTQGLAALRFACQCQGAHA